MDYRVAEAAIQSGQLTRRWKRRSSTVAQASYFAGRLFLLICNDTTEVQPLPIWSTRTAIQKRPQLTGLI